MNQGIRLKKIRNTLGKTGKEFASKLTWSDSHQYQIEKNSKINEENIKQISEAYGINCEYLREGIGTMFKDGTDGLESFDDINVKILNEVKALRIMLEKMNSGK